MPDADLIAIRMRLTGGKQVAAEAKAANSAIAQTGAATAKASTAQASAAARAAKASTTLRSVGRGLTTYVTLPLAGVGAAAGYMALDFDRSMRNVNSIAQLPERSFQRLQQQVLDMAGPTAQAPKTLSEGLYDLVSSGFDAKESVGILRHAALAASAGLSTTETSTKAVAAALNAYRLPAGKAGLVSDQLFETVNRGVVTFDELATTIGDVLPFAAQLEVNLGEVGAAISTMTKQGLNSAESSTRLKNVLVTLLKPGEDLTKTLKEMGTSGEKLVARRGLQGALEAILQTTDGTKESVTKLFPNIRALGGVLSLTGINASGARSDLAAFNDVAGSTQTVLKEQEQSFGFQLQRGWAELSAVLIELGEDLLPIVIPFVLDLASGAREVVGAFAALPDPAQKVVLGMTALVALTGPMLMFAGAVLKASVSLGLLNTTAGSGVLLSGRGKGALGLLGKAGLVGLGVGASQVAGGAVGGDVGSLLGNVGSGAAIGAGVGSIVPGVGTALGAAIGGTAGGALTAVQKLSAAEKDLSPVQAKLARDSEQLARGMTQLRNAGQNLAPSVNRVRRAHNRQDVALRAVQVARRRVKRAEDAYGSTAGQTIAAERRLQRAIRGKTSALRAAQRAERKQGIARQQFLQIARTNLLNQRNEVNVLSRKKGALDREWVAAKRSGAGQQRLNDLASRGQSVEGRLRNARKKGNEILLEVAEKAGPKYAEAMRKMNRETLEAGGTFKLARERVEGLMGALDRIAERPRLDLSIDGPRGGGGRRVPGGADGFTNFRGGLALVGERGPELVNLPGGSDVFPTPRTRELIGEPRPAAIASRSGEGRSRILAPITLKVGRRELANVVAEAEEDEKARL